MNRININVFLVGWMPLLFLCTLTCYSQSSIRILSLDNCIKTGLTNATEVLKGQNAVEQAGAQVLYAYGEYLPSVNFSGGYNYSSGNSSLLNVPFMGTLDKSAYYYQLTSTINIYSGQYTRANFKASIFNKKGQELTLQWARQEVALDIIQTFLQVMLDKKLQTIQKENLLISEKREEQITALTEVGRLTMVDLFQQQAQTSLDQAALSNAMNKLRSDKILFLTKLRLNAKDSLEKYDFDELPLDDQPQAEKYDNENNLVRQALANRTDLQANEMNIDMAAWNIKKYYSGYLPKVSFQAGAFNSGLYYDYLYYDHQVETPSAQNNLSYQLTHQVYGLAGVNATWNIFDNNYTKSNVISAKAQYRNAQIDYRDQRLQIVSDVRQAFGDYKNDLQLIETANKGLIAAEKAFQAMQDRYIQGSASFIDVVTTQINLLTAKESQIQAIINFMLEKRTLDYLLGSDY
jgi:outer membrane protein